MWRDQINYKNHQLGNLPVDFAATALKAIVGAAPVIGSFLSEVVGLIIPNLCFDRLIQFAGKLDCRLGKLEKSFIKYQFNKNEKFIDLLEEGLKQAANSLSDDRREYLANLIAYSITKSDAEMIESKHIIKILNELNDAEIIWLKSFDILNIENMNEFQTKHAEILEPIYATMNSPSSTTYRESIQKSYLEHLVKLRLIKEVFKIDSKTKMPEYNHMTGEQIVSHHEITTLGIILLKEISISNGYDPQ